LLALVSTKNMLGEAPLTIWTPLMRAGSSVLRTNAVSTTSDDDADPPALLVELGDNQTVWANPQHPYTQALMAAIPHADGGGVLPEDLPGDVPDPADPPAGCRFHPRCPIAEDSCSQLDQRLAEVAGREIACHVRAGLARQPAGG